MIRRRAFRCGQILAAILVAAGLLTACDEGNGFPTTCDRPESDEPTHYKGGGIVDGIYWSSDWGLVDGEEPIVDGEPLYFPGGAYYRLHHELGKIPDWFLFYLSFEPSGVTEGKLALAAGNQVEVESMDQETITIVNGTCTSYWLIARVGQIDEE